MTLTLELAPDVEARLRDHAAREGLDAAEAALRLIEDGLTRGEALPAPERDEVALRRRMAEQWNTTGAEEGHAAVTE